MRHRIGGVNGFGNPDRPLLDNKGILNAAFADDVLNGYFKKWEGFDYEITEDRISVGLEPAYAGEPLKIICICKRKEASYIRTGHAFGMYGSGIRSKYRFYEDYKYNSKFKKFVDKWHGRLFP